MISIKKHCTDIENIFIYFQFIGYDDWEDFDNLLLVLTNQIKCTVIEKLVGIYSKHCTLEKDGFVFKLMFHEDFGNCLCNQNKKTDDYYDYLESIAKEIVRNLPIGKQD